MKNEACSWLSARLLGLRCLCRASFLTVGVRFEKSLWSERRHLEVMTNPHKTHFYVDTTDPQRQSSRRGNFDYAEYAASSAAAGPRKHCPSATQVTVERLGTAQM